jgi:hypothetical protein
MSIAVDYLVKGAGASAMGFVDVLLQQSDATVAIVDRGAAPGGHWNHAYPFVRLHQPAPFYGLASRPLGDDRVDTDGVNAGMAALPSGLQVADHYHRVMDEVFLPSGRVVYHPMSELTDDNEIVSLLSGRRQRVQVNRRRVDATHLETAIPLTHRRPFDVEGEVACVPPNDLPLRAPGFAHFAVIGGGKTGLDCVSWLLDAGAAPGSITWVVSRSAWWSNRRAFQTSARHRSDTLGMMVGTFEAMAFAATVDDLCDRMESARAWLRTDREVRPTMFHAATVTQAELDRIGGIGRVLRGDKVRRLEPGRMVMQGGAVPMPAATLYVDCTASALARSRFDRTPVFGPGRIDLQIVRFPAIAQSVALIAFIEANIHDEDEKRAMTRTVPMIDTVEDWIDRTAISLENQAACMANARVRAWLAASRLNPLGAMMGSIPADDVQACARRDRIRELTPLAAQNIGRLRAGLPA